MMDPITVVVRVMLISFLYPLIFHGATDACRFGNNADCAFPCNCNGDMCDSDTGSCPSGCKSGQPPGLGYDWTGPGCQIGNVAYDKSTNQTGAFDRLYSLYAVDGNIGSGSTGDTYCAHPDNTGNQPAEWTVDLGDTYTVYNVTIYNAHNPGGSVRLTNFDLWVEETSDSRELCAFYNDTAPEPSASLTIQCGGGSGYTGRYVHLRRREGYQADLITLCEVIVWGHKYIDCSACPAGTSCGNIIGCDRCQIGKQLPDCEDCADGFYGVNCVEICGHCKSPSDCNPVTGSCLYGCQLWWAGDTCKIAIVKPGCCQGDEGLDLIEDSAVTSSTVTISWTQETSVPQGYDSYYGYIISFRKNGDVNKQFERIPHDSKESKLKSVVTGLDENTLYYFEVTSYRRMENQENSGTAYVEQSIETKCSVPEKPVITSVTVSVQDKTSFTLHYELPDYKDNGCYEVVFQYKDSMATAWIERLLPRTPKASSVTVAGLTKDSYYARIHVHNTDAEIFSETTYVSFTQTPQTTELTNPVTGPETVSSGNTPQTTLYSTTPLTAPVTDSNESQESQGKDGEKSSNTPMIIAVSVVVVVIVVALTVIVVVILVLRNRRRQNTKEETSVSYINQNVTIEEPATSADDQQEDGEYEDVIIDDHQKTEPEPEPEPQSNYQHLQAEKEHDYENKFNTGPYATINN